MSQATMNAAPHPRRQPAANSGRLQDFPAGDESFLNVVGGNPTDEELAALTAVVLGMAGGQVPDAAPTPGNTPRTWARRQMLRLAPRPGPGAWRRSSR